MYILIAGSGRDGSVEYYGHAVYGALSIGEAKEHFETEQFGWGIIATVEVEEYQVKTRTVAYYNVSVSGRPAAQRWTDIKSS